MSTSLEKTKRELDRKIHELEISKNKLEGEITERKQVEEALKESEERFRTVLQTAVDAVISADSSSKIISWNRGAQTIFGYGEKEVLGKQLTILMPERYREAQRKGMEQSSLTGEARVIEKTVCLHGLRKDGSEFPLELSLSSWEAGKGKFYTGIIRDITERRQMEKELQKLASTDGLTKAYNRAKYNEIIEREMERAKRYNSFLCMIILDVDHFKRVNDTYGHVVGDHVLKNVVDVIKENMRQTDYIVRWGGEEFVLVAPETDLEGAKVLVERVRKAVEGYKFDKVGRVTVSLGIAQFKENDTKDGLIKRADNAMYKAKTGGRNRFEVGL
jgi:diguanylate cyclase (GGDEF)-like protein/PAS domain S-box-containing protein